MNESFKIGRIAGIDVYLHSTFFLLFLFEGIQSFYRGDNVKQTLISLALLACVFVIVAFMNAAMR